jgi:hypothetical protein
MITPTINYDYAKLDGIFNHFGWLDQLVKLKEELNEIIDEINNVLDGRPDKLNQEIADGLNVLLQIYHADKKDREEIDVAMLEKQIRTLTRIEEKYYD